jgi:hypothetical protein
MQRASRSRQSDVRRFKETTVFEWENEPAQGRPSDFVPSTSTGPLSGLGATSAGTRRPAYRRGGGFLGFIVFLLTVLAAGAWALHWFASFVKR